MNPDNGTPLDSSKVQKIIQELAEEFLPNPEEAEWLEARCWRRFGGTVVSAFGTSMQNAVALEAGLEFKGSPRPCTTPRS